MVQKSLLSLVICSILAACTWLPIPQTEHSIEFGHTAGSPDYCVPVEAPEGGTLFSVWTKLPDILEAPDTAGRIHGNMTVYVLKGTNWHILALVGNIYAYPDGTAQYNANYMLGIGDTGMWAGDYCLYLTPKSQGISLETANDWVWVAWQVVVTHDSMIFRQWLKFGIDGKVIKAGNQKCVNAGDPYAPLDPEGEEIVDFAFIRSFITNQANYSGGITAMTEDEAAAWAPSDAVSFQVGYDNSYLCHARMEARSTEPSLAELEAISTSNTPDLEAWADYELNWKYSKPNLLDRSGHGRSLTIQAGGTLNQGVLGPELDRTP